MRITRRWSFLASSFVGSACAVGALAGIVEDRVVSARACAARAALLAEVPRTHPDSYL